MSNKKSLLEEDDVEFSCEFPSYREKNVREPVEKYTIHNVMLKPFLDKDGLLTGQRVLDLACGHGHYTRQLKSLNAHYVLGIDASSAIINIAKQIENDNPQQIQYEVNDVNNLSSPDIKFDLVTAFYLFDYATNTNQLKQMIEIIYQQLGDNKPFIGIIGNVLAGRNMFNQRKYGITRHTNIEVKDDIPDETEIFVTLYNEFDEPLTPFINYHYSPQTYEDLFKQIGFKSFQWVPYQYYSNASDTHFFDDLILAAPSIGIVAIK